MRISEFLNSRSSLESSLNFLLEPPQIINLSERSEPLLHPLLRFLNESTFFQPEDFDRFYTSPVTCLYLFRLFDVPTQLHIARLLYIHKDDPFEFGQLRQWVHPSQKSPQNTILSKLKSLNILNGHEKFIWLNLNFQRSLQLAFSGLSQADFLQKYMGEYENLNLEFFEEFSESQWSNLLLNMVEKTNVSIQTKENPSSTHVFLRGGLDFFLKPKSCQLWLFLFFFIDFLIKSTGSSYYPQQSTSNSSTLVWTDTFYFIFQLALGPRHVPLSTSSLSKWIQEIIIPEFYSIGLLLHPTKFPSYFFVTSLADHLLSSHSSSSSLLSRREEFIILETNFNLYAYTNSPLDISILSLFVNLKARFPNLVTGTLTRDSLQRAFEKGIQTSHIIQYLEEHAHPQMRAQIQPPMSVPTDSFLTQPHTPTSNENSLSSHPSATNKISAPMQPSEPSSVIAVTIKDQLLLWEAEQYRIKTEPAFLYSQFIDTLEYTKAKEFSRQQGHLLYALDTKRLLVVTQLGHQAIKSFMKES